MISRSASFKLGLAVITSIAPLIGRADVARNRSEAPVTYTGSSFNEVIRSIEDQNFTPIDAAQAAELEVYRSGKLPQYKVSFTSLVFSRLLSASKRTLIDEADSYSEGFAKMVHSNGICVSGEWIADRQSEFSGYFGQGNRGLFIGRVSVALEKTTNADDRGFGFAGKIFPTTNPEEAVKTANFFTVDILSGAKSRRFLDVALTNNPPLTPSLALAGVLSKIVPAFMKADSSPMYRPVSQIARLGTHEGDAVKSPVYMRLHSVAGLQKSDKADFREEVIEALSLNDNLIKFDVDASTTTNDRLVDAGWTHVGQIVVDRAYLTYGCDRKLHFGHPKDDHATDKKK